jgi:hypothetical protein
MTEGRRSVYLDRSTWPTRPELRTAVVDYIDCFYNR